MVNTTDGNSATANTTTQVTLNQGAVQGSIYGGGLGDLASLGEGHTDVAANVFGPVTVTVNGGSVGGSVFGCNNLNGTPKSTVEVTINGSDATDVDDETGAKTYAIGGVYGGGNLAHYDPTDPTDPDNKPVVVINNCSTSVKDVFGGGNAAAVTATDVTINGGDIDRVFAGGNGVSGTPAHVGWKNTNSNPATDDYGSGETNAMIHGGTINQVFGGSNANGVIRSTISVAAEKQSICPIHVDELYGGGNLAPSNVGNITIGCMDADDIIDNVYGGANQADITGNIHLIMTGGRVGNLFGGNNTSGTISGSITVDVEKDDDLPCESNWYLGNVFGGGNLATFGTDIEPKAPTVNIKNGTVSGNVYGGGKGNSEDHTKGQVTGNPVVTIGDNDESYQVTVSGSVFGGGDAGNVEGTPVVTVVNKCNTTIGSVYGGGNAADVSATNVIINGGNITGDVFGGGHGDKDADPPLQADVEGNTSVNVTGGTINRVFGGSNSKGTIDGTISVNITKGANSCDMHITEVYGGGNFAASNVGNITIGCMDADDIIDNVYGGANQADITGNIHLIMTGGRVGNLFGGNNTSGTISGSITVDVEKDDDLPCESNWYLGNVFGGGNLATFGTDIEPKAPTVNIKNGTVSGNVYGGGKGNSEDHTKGQVTGNPVVTIGDNDESYQVTVSGSVFGGGDAGNVEGTPVVTVVNKCNTTIGSVYGGGNAADVSATNVIINGGNITGDVFGGGHGDKDADPPLQADVEGNTSVNVTGGTINRVFGGSNSKGTIDGTISVNITKGANSCDMHITEVYGGGNFAASNAGNIAIHCTGTGDTEGIEYVYGGANRADVTGPIELTIDEGRIGNVFGGNNNDGSITNGITVNIEKKASPCVWDIGNVFGGGNLAVYTGTPVVNIKNGTVANVYGGGNGDPNDSSQVQGQVAGTNVTIGDATEGYCAVVTGNVYGGGNAAKVAGNTLVTYNDGNASSTVANLFGGGNAAGVTGTTTVTLTNGTVSTGLYGGCNTSGTVGGNITVNVNGGTVGSQTNLDNYTVANVFGGGFGASTSTLGDVEVNINGALANIYGDVYGGSALGNVNTENGNNTTTVNILDGTLHSVTDNSTGFTVYHGGNVYGGGLGRKADSEHSAVEAKVFGAVTVNIGTGTPSLTETGENFTGNATIGGNVYGANNTNGSPQDNVTVNIYRTAHTTTDEYDYDPDSNEGVPATFAIANVFGGGNEANYAPENGSTNTTKKATVNIYGCYNTIRRSFGGGNAAATPSVETDIQGGRFFQVFGGGNGERGPLYAANINGDLTLSIHGGNVGQFYGISNQYGNVSGTATVNTDNSGPCGAMMIDEFFCGGNYADITGDLVTTISCSEGMRVNSLYGGCHQANITGNVVLNVEGGTFENVYGGSKGVEGTPANITGNVTLNLYGGIIGNVYGGSNVNGNIGGIITVNVIDNESSSCPLHITNIYGGSNETDYEPNEISSGVTPVSPIVNVVHAKYGISGNVYGGSKGKEDAAIPTAVNSHPLVNIGYNSDMNTYLPSTYEVPASPRAIVAGDVYGGGDAAKVEGNTAIFLRNRAKVFGNVYGGGNMGEVSGNTKVIVNGDNE